MRLRAGRGKNRRRADRQGSPAQSAGERGKRMNLPAAAVRRNRAPAIGVGAASRWPSNARDAVSTAGRDEPGLFPRRLRRMSMPDAAAAGGRSSRSARQARVCLRDDFAVLEVERPRFRKQLAHTCEPASGLGGTVGDVGRLHDEAPYRWRVRDNPNHSGASPSCEMRFRYMRIPDTLCCCHATCMAERACVADRRAEAVPARLRGEQEKGRRAWEKRGAITGRSTRTARTVSASRRAAPARDRCPARAGSRATSR